MSAPSERLRARASRSVPTIAVDHRLARAIVATLVIGGYMARVRQAHSVGIRPRIRPTGVERADATNIQIPIARAAASGEEIA
jgi:hypothetical protein